MSDETITQQDNARQRPKGRRKPRDGEIGIRYGSRNYLKTPGQMLVAKKGKWHLVAYPTPSRIGWWNFKLYLNQRGAPKNMFGLGLNRGRFVTTRDNGILVDYFPEIAEWALQQAKLYADGKLMPRKEEGRAVIYREGKGWLLHKGKNNG